MNGSCCYDACCPQRRSTPDSGKPAATSSVYKGAPVLVIEGATAANTSNVKVDCTDYNAVSLYIVMESVGSTVITTRAAPTYGGPYLAVTDPNSGKTYTDSDITDIIVGPGWVDLQLTSTTGKWTVYATPYIAPGPTNLVASVP